ncbi:MAG TPA: kelch repeat-containing protein [Thermoanaerobaculia bacterium]|nr:kelch repeat-containing protein [Thermoanaerobaculia bacterium]
MLPAAFAAAILAAGWLELAPVLIPRQEVAVTAANGKLYLIGGISGSAILTSVEEYDPSTGLWRFVAPLPEPRHHAAAATVGGSLYVIGGYQTLAFDPQRSVFRYDIANDRWFAVASLPAPRGALAAVAIDGRIYAVGGVPDGTALAVYDPSTNAWTTLAPMPTPREHLAAAAVDGILYVAGGRFTSGNIAAFERFDPSTGSWTVLPDLPTARSGIAAAAIGVRVYVFGGEGNTATSTGVFAQTESYDVTTGTWQVEPEMRNPRHGIGAATIGTLIHIPAGSPLQGFGTTTAHDAFFANANRRRAVRH